MSDRLKTERPAAAPGLDATTSINNLTFLLGVGAVVAAVVGGSCSTNARIGDVRADVADLRVEVRELRAEVRGEVAGLRTEFGGLRNGVQGEVAGLRTEFGGLRNGVQGEVAGLRTEFGGLRNGVQGEVAGLRTEFGGLRGEIHDVREEVRDVRARLDDLEDFTHASFATVHQQLGAVAVCMLEIRNLVGGDGDDRERASTACDSALQAILTPSTPAGP